MSISTISIATAQANLTQAFEQNEELHADLSKELAGLSKNPDLALMQILMILGSESGGTMGVAENSVNQDAQQMNIMTALSVYTKDMTTDVNTISNPSSSSQQRTDAANDLITQCNNLQKALNSPNIPPWTNPVTGIKETSQWISSSMQVKAQSGLTAFMTQVGAGSGAGAVVSNITGWVNSPTTGTPTGQEQIQAMNKDLSVLGNLFQSLSTVAQNVVKEGNTTLTQYQSNESTLFTDLIALNKGIVAHLGGG